MEIFLLSTLQIPKIPFKEFLFDIHCNWLDQFRNLHFMWIQGNFRGLCTYSLPLIQIKKHHTFLSYIFKNPLLLTRHCKAQIAFKYSKQNIQVFFSYNRFYRKIHSCYTFSREGFPYTRIDWKIGELSAHK